MQTPPEIVFEGLPSTLRTRDVIEAHLTELEQRWGRITACRVVAKAPGQHHHKGGLYEVHIHLALPDGREVNVTRTPPAEERHSDLTFAIDDAFKTRSSATSGSSSPRAGSDQASPRPSRGDCRANLSLR
jgi:Sigma 54 modulation protein / S30EA ribosomal protein